MQQEYLLILMDQYSNFCQYWREQLQMISIAMPQPRGAYELQRSYISATNEKRFAAGDIIHISFFILPAECDHTSKQDIFRPSTSIADATYCTGRNNHKTAVMAALSAEAIPAKENVKTQPKLLDTFDPRRIKELHDLKPHPVTGRLIDSYPGKRTKPMRVLCLGFPRTGTMSLFTALKILGYNPWHMAVAVGENPRTNMALWCEALKAKFQGEGKPWGKEEFDKVLGDYDSLLDVPAICFAEELMAAYPEAKIILNYRDMESWMRSYDNTCGRVMRWNWDLVASWDPSLAGPYWDCASLVVPIAFGTLVDFSSPASPARQAFADHYAMVRDTAPRDRLLEFKSTDGWQPICSFLGVAEPDEEYPRINDANEYLHAHRMMWWLAFRKMAVKVSLTIAIPVAGVVAAMWWRKYR